MTIPSRGGGGWQSTGASLWVYRQGKHGTKAGCWWFFSQPSFPTNGGAPLDVPGTNVPVAACLQRRGLMVARVRPVQPTIAFCRMPSRACASTACLIPIGVARGSIGIIIYKNWETICSSWFELATVQSSWLNDHLSCGFEFRRSHLALKWKSGQGKVVFHRAAFTGTFLSISGHWKHNNSIPIDLVPQMGG